MIWSAVTQFCPTEQVHINQGGWWTAACTDWSRNWASKRALRESTQPWLLRGFQAQLVQVLCQLCNSRRCLWACLNLSLEWWLQSFCWSSGCVEVSLLKVSTKGSRRAQCTFPPFFGFKSHDVETGLELVGVVRSIVWTVSLINDDFGAMTDSYRLKGLVSNSKSWIRQMLAGAKCCICASACAWPWMHVWNCAPASHVNSEMFNPCFSCICFDPRFLSMPGSQVPPNWTAVELFSEDLLQDLGCRKRGSLCLHSLLNHYLWGCLKMRWLAKIMVNNTDTFIW